MGYGAAPWVFTGRALYQLMLVKTEEARKYVPDSFKLVEAFGYTLGGFYLARYDDSPAGTFNELVILAGLAWNPPTSCAWASRVYVDSREARDHGLKSVGLPSRQAQFQAPEPAAASGAGASSSVAKRSWWWQERSAGASSKQMRAGPSPASTSAGDAPAGSVRITNVDDRAGARVSLPVCTIMLPEARAPGAFAGPRIKLALPSFSGATPDCPMLLKYACALLTNVRVVAPAAVSLPPLPSPSASASGSMASQRQQLREQEEGGLVWAVLGGKPLVALAFDDMVMTVDQPEVLEMPSKNTRSAKAARVASGVATA